MEHVYLIVNTFLDLIVRQDVLPESKFNEFDYLELRIFLQLYNIFSWTYGCIVIDIDNFTVIDKCNRFMYVFVFRHFTKKNSDIDLVSG